jgi:peptidoglycan/xylan/chitin deacetylase (PgdA/CDA1 family)
MPYLLRDLYGRKALSKQKNDVILLGGTILEDFESLDGFTTGNGASIELSTDFKTGSKSLRLYTESEDFDDGYIDKNINFDLSNMNTISFNIWIEDITKLTFTDNCPFQLYLGQGGFVNYVVANVITLPYAWQNGWNNVKFIKSDLVVESGSVDYDNPFTIMRIRVRGVWGQFYNLKLDTLRKNDNVEPSIINMWDDGHESVKNVISYSMGKGVKHDIPIVKDWVGTAGYMTLNELKQAYQLGHGIMNHSTSHPNLTELTEEQILAEIVTCRDYLYSNGFSKSADFFAVPGSNYNATVRNQLINANVKLSRSNWLGITAIPPEDRLNLRYVLVTSNTTTTEQIQWIIDRAIEYKTTIILMHHFVSDEPLDEYTMATDVMEFMIDYIENSGITSLTIADWYKKYKTYLR